MSIPNDHAQLRTAASVISQFKKRRFLTSLSEDDFRDQVVRPLFFRLGLKDGRDVCGPDEEGKDAIFLAPSPFGTSDVVVVQTKKGKVTLAGKARENLLNAIAQLRTAAETKVTFLKTKEKRLPAKVMLCASGEINSAARKHIGDEISDPRLQFFDSDELIPLIDEHYPELWLGLDSEVMPYLRALRRAIEESSESLAVSEILPEATAAATDGMFVELYLWRNVLRPRKRKGQVESVPEFVEIPVTGILKRAERLVLILGEAGSGKSTSVRRLAYVLAGTGLNAQADIDVPILLRAVDLARAGDLALVDAGAAETRRLSGSKHAAFSNDDLINGCVVFLVDALDEVADDAGRKSVLDRIRAFHDSYPECLVVVTSREYSFLRSLPDLAGFTRYRVQKISFRQAEQLVEKMAKRGRLPVASSKEFVRRLEQIHGMDLSPLLVTVFAATSEYARKDIPANITELFKKFTEIMLGRWDVTKGFAHQYHVPVKEFVLSRVAFEMHLAKVTEIPVTEFRARVAAELRSRGHEADVEQLLDEIVNRSGLLRIVGEQIEFRHLLLQEFYAGRGIPSEELLDSFIFDDWWRRAVVFYFGDRPSNATALARVRDVIGSRSAAERFTAAGTFGLALQACYLVPVTEKLSGLVTVIENLADVKDYVVDKMSGAAKFPLTGFLSYYLNGRDSVALSLLETAAPELIGNVTSRDAAPEANDLRQFWVIVGLIEAGHVVDAEALVRKFQPSDPRLLLAIHLGCFLIQHVRVSTDEQRKAARRICDRLAESISHLRAGIFQEFKSHLLEMRKGEILALPEPET